MKNWYAFWLEQKIRASIDQGEMHSEDITATAELKLEQLALIENIDKQLQVLYSLQQKHQNSRLKLDSLDHLTIQIM